MNTTLKKLYPNLKKVRDSKKTIVIEVTRDDERASQRFKHSECAMAIACKRKFHLDGVLIGRSISYLIRKNQAVRFKTPVSVSREITSFDRGARFEPGVYSLGKIHKKNKRPLGNRTVTGKKMYYYHITKNIREVLSGENPVAQS